MEKKSIIIEIYIGSRGNGGSVKQSKTYLKLMEEISQLEQTLTEKLGEEEKDLLEEIDALSCALEAEAALGERGVRGRSQMQRSVAGNTLRKPDAERKC